MKRIWECALVAASFQPLCTFADTSSVELYGRINVAAENVRASAATEGEAIASRNRVSNNRSVVGFRGDEPLTGDLKVIWQIESSVPLDGGSGLPPATFASRDSRVGLAGGFGTFFVGIWGTPYTNSTKNYDPYYPTTAGYMSLMGNGSASSTDNSIDTNSFDRRQRNIIEYWTPRFAGFSAEVAYGPNEERTAQRNPDLWSFSATYENGPLNVTAAHERHKDYQGGGLTDTGSKVGAAYQWGGTRLAGVFERLKYETPSGDLKRDAWYVSLVQKIGNGAIQAGFTRAKAGTGSSADTVGFFASGAETGAKQYTLGYEYALSKRTSLYGYYTNIDNEAHAIYDFAINELGVAAGADPSGFALGIKHNF